MRGPRPTPFVLLVALAAQAGGVAAQGSPLSLRARVGGVSTAGAFTLPVAVEGEMTGGTSFGLHFDYRSGDLSGVYVGFSQHRFDCGGPGCPGGGEYVHTGWDVGGRFGLASGPVRPWVRLGVVFARIERNFVTGGLEERGLSDLSAGAEVGLGVAVPVRGRFGVEGGGRYVWMNATFPGEGLMRMRYFVTDVGMTVRF